MAITTINKAKLGVDDLLIDDTGTFQSYPRKTSRAGVIPIRKLNASHIPVTTTVRDSKYADQATATTKNDLDVDAVLDQIMAHLEAQGLPDVTNFFTVNASTGNMTIKADAITATELKDDASTDANRAVTTNHIRDANVTTAKIADLAVTNGKLATSPRAVDSAQIVAGAIDHEHLAVDTVDKDILNMDGAGATFSHFIVGGVIATQIASGNGTQVATVTVSGAATGMGAIGIVAAATNVISIKECVVSGVDTVTLETYANNWSTTDTVTVIVFKATAAIP